MPLLEAKCHFEKTLFYDDIITIRTQVEEMKTKTIHLKHEVYRGDTRTGYGYEIRGWVRQTENEVKAVPIPEDVRKILKENIHLNDREKRPLFNA